MRLLIKLSGESLGQDETKFFEPRLNLIAEEIKKLIEEGHQIAIVVGGGNLFRGRDLAGKLSVERPTADYIGMLSTVQNGLVIADYFKSVGIDTRVSSAITMHQICESYIPKKAIRHLEKGRLVIFVAGLGNPYFSTDSTAVQRALEIKAEILIMAKFGVDGSYTADPRKDKNAQKIKICDATRFLNENLSVADQASIALAKEQGLKIKIVSIEDIVRAMDDDVGSVVLPK